ncbi:MAG: urease accessory protein UreD [Acidiferrobacterales bacterium]|nr:urease accessory protein UreD [Acidiferrobacterales bacterium]
MAMASLALKSDQPSTPAQLARVGHWQGSLNLGLAVVDGKTVIKSKHQSGPYTIQRSLYPEAAPNNGICHLILLHPPGGLVEGDNLSLNIDCLEHSHSLITTPSAGKVYQCEVSDAGQTQKFTIHAGAALEWFPQEMILFDKSLSTLRTEIDLVDDAKFAGWEIVCLGRPIAQDMFQQGRVIQTVELRRNSKPMLIERINIDASNTALRSQQWGLAGRSVFGTFIMTDVGSAHFDRARLLVEDFEQLGCSIGVTLIDDILVCRGLSNQSRHLKKAFSQIWCGLRQDVFGVAAQEPRIWCT